MILPDKNLDITDIENKVDVTLTSFADFGSKRRVTLRLPKFKIVQEIELKQSLVEVNANMKDLFCGRCNPDFSKMGKGSLYISKATQKVFMEVNEEGSEGAAATVVVMSRFRSTVSRKEFTVDRPFIFVIRDTATDLILFQGKVVDPTVHT